MLDRLFDADRADLITEVVLSAVREFNLELHILGGTTMACQLHNDSTTVNGHNKDHRSD